MRLADGVAGVGGAASAAEDAEVMRGGGDMGKAVAFSSSGCGALGVDEEGANAETLHSSTLGMSS